MELALNADVVVFSTSRMNEFIIPRLKTGKLTFEYSERWFKKDYKLNILSKNLWKHQLMYYRFGRKTNLYMLCASAYAANDYYLLNSYKNRCFKWAYFTRVIPIDIDSILNSKRYNKTKIMWCSRFISWKHPEMIVDLASMLKENGYSFEINMYGSGPLVEEIRRKIGARKLENCVKLIGPVPNEEIITAMRNHNIFLFTSDQNEGWGAVANEAMSNGCALVASHQIGSVPFLVENGENGLIFKSKNINSLYANVVRLLDDHNLCERMARRAYYDMINIWSPQIAAARFQSLVTALQNKEQSPFYEGPCSKAVPCK
jgi:glycosyltransferase involved in cell wall biosynthesis